MQKKIYKILVLVLVIFALTSCAKKDNIIFKEDYESLNGTTNKNGKEHRTVTINKHNAIVISNAKEIVEKIENEDTFYVYFGSNLCPWCRSVIEKAIEVSNNNEVDKIYYVDIWDSEGNEILRDKYSLGENNTPVKEIEGTEEYYKLLSYFDNLLEDYTYELDDQKLSYGEKRIYAPTFFYISKGKAVRMTTGISDNQKDAREELTEEILKDEEQKFDEFFINICDESC